MTSHTVLVFQLKQMPEIMIYKEKRFFWLSVLEVSIMISWSCCFGDIQNMMVRAQGAAKPLTIGREGGRERDKEYEQETEITYK